MIRHGVLALLLGWVASRPTPTVVSPEQAKPIEVARLRLVSGTAQKFAPGQGWKEVRSGARLATGEKVRVGGGAVLSVEFPWMRITAGPDTTLGLAPSSLLATLLEEGRLEQDAEAGIIKLRTPEALVRGEGHLVVRREDGVTGVTVVRGKFQVQAAGATIVLRPGQGTIVRAGRAPETPMALPRTPGGLSPGADPVYVVSGRPIRLSWSPGEVSNHIQVFGLEPGELLLARDVGSPPVEIEMPDPGTYRWRVAARTAKGLEGVPSVEGVICVVAK